jgi:hypothetical protein
MTQKVRRPKVNVPSYVKISAMLSPKRTGVTDRNYIKSMVVAIDGYNKKRNESMKKIYKDTSSEE